MKLYYIYFYLCNVYATLTDHCGRIIFIIYIIMYNIYLHMIYYRKFTAFYTNYSIAIFIQSILLQSLLIVIKYLQKLVTDHCWRIMCNRAFWLVVRSFFVFVNNNWYWLKLITWFILANHSCCFQKQLKIKLQVEKLYKQHWNTKYNN